MKHKISVVEEDSIAGELGVLPGDYLLAVDGETIIDILDYRFRLSSDCLLIEVEKSDGEVWELDIVKEESEDIGLVFESPLMSNIKLCENKCIFCFVDQEPPGLRKTLYVKDDDWRLSFLHGNFITLTNLSDEESKRITHLHLSPLNISVHSADVNLRQSMMGSKNAGNLFRHLRFFGEAGITMNFQIVLCKDINDGDVLDMTILMLERLLGANSLAVVPAGLTRYRDSLSPIKTFTPVDATRVIHRIEAMQHLFFSKRASAFVFLSDEWYIMANKMLPAYKKYENFPQLSNGVGMIRMFEFDFLNQLRKLPKSDKSMSVSIATGTLAASFMRNLIVLFCKKFVNVRIAIIAVENRFYGETVTVSGLLTGSDVLSQCYNISQTDELLFLPGNAFRACSGEMIDGMTISQLSENLSLRVVMGSQNGGDFAVQLYREILC